MKKWGLFLNNQLIESFDDGKEAMEKSLKLSAETGEKYLFRPVRFTDMTNEEKLFLMSEKSKDLQLFLEQMKGSGRTYYSHTNIEADELEWLVQMATENLKESPNK
ncbi:hypothetical protein CVD28_01470 [Bacillus sp. M6-12]|uniref:hypothetical protein n=1 Tax=Bacillus sp. M6-12 TaxID=2054166 RepID=UPI000C76FDEE|nr:hypothetical protein [Bacillus sp. M6-12]PLS19104.1 hypothetical protein CVD28_01470 [Bacillus sp. M6-12]